MRTIDINADLGEGCDLDARLIPLVSSANIACGGHAGDDSTMHRTIQSCMEAGVAIGAHPGYEDRTNFGRAILSLPHSQIRESVHRQIADFLRIAMEYGASPHHVKLHGALYTQANSDEQLASALVGTIASLMPGTMIYCPPSGKLALTAKNAGLQPVPEGFIDRRYQADGSLMPRSEPGAIITNISESVEQALRMCQRQEVITSSATIIPLHACTLCIHGDGIQALPMMRSIRSILESNGYMIQSPTTCIS